jgi:hypothetical protein
MAYAVLGMEWSWHVLGRQWAAPYGLGMVICWDCCAWSGLGIVCAGNRLGFGWAWDVHVLGTSWAGLAMGLQ